MISVVIPVYNGAAYLARTLESALKQTYSDIEILLINDGSDDATLDIAKCYANRDHRIKIFSQNRQGVAAARNAGLKAASGDLIAPLDSDDLWHPQKLELQAALLTVNDKIGLVYCLAVRVNENDRVMGGTRNQPVDQDITSALAAHNFVGCASVPLIRKGLMLELGGYSGEFRAKNAEGCEDWHLYLQLSRKCQFGYVNRILVGYRRHGNSMSSHYKKMYRSEMLVCAFIEEHIPEVPPAVVRQSLARAAFRAFNGHVRELQTGLAFRRLVSALKADPILIVKLVGNAIFSRNDFNRVEPSQIGRLFFDAPG